MVDYGAGNLRSVANALTRVDAEFEVTDDPADLDGADRIVFPGVGAASSCMEALADRGLDAALKACEQPVLGICLGMQVLTESSTEGGEEID
ncbi:MAG: imidazole glycerol phosphate synthase subunit HisH, partial [Actinobacteria bacterium]|nr:imidazole glycerol phosphate synthase subunit HisH [Actinomycetota bacterium]NIU70531.1 imidazole glycerol phosphate synthase subunit HisH [Actinomycetota bacterium]NIV90157.1 imidazole glycerol phosphate synthase subunit HisH [Actinomycetota bacterium]NIW32435.1 imidazole glycerol phosphate synthase subunit HisH [Actinomycetota bacterium]NIX24641.1 imidazole glycerol phosphate synthase subunit HisH [Actinomycetota bacterium]